MLLFVQNVSEQVEGIHPHVHTSVVCHPDLRCTETSISPFTGIYRVLANTGLHQALCFHPFLFQSFAIPQHEVGTSLGSAQPVHFSALKNILNLKNMLGFFFKQLKHYISGPHGCNVLWKKCNQFNIVFLTLQVALIISSLRFSFPQMSNDSSVIT